MTTTTTTNDAKRYSIVTNKKYDAYFSVGVNKCARPTLTRSLDSRLPYKSKDDKKFRFWVRSVRSGTRQYLYAENRNDARNPLMFMVKGNSTVIHTDVTDMSLVVMSRKQFSDIQGGERELGIGKRPIRRPTRKRDGSSLVSPRHTDDTDRSGVGTFKGDHITDPRTQTTYYPFMRLRRLTATSGDAAQNHAVLQFLINDIWYAIDPDTLNVTVKMGADSVLTVSYFPPDGNCACPTDSGMGCKLKLLFSEYHDVWDESSVVVSPPPTPKQPKEDGDDVVVVVDDDDDAEYVEDDDEDDDVEDVVEDNEGEDKKWYQNTYVKYGAVVLLLIIIFMLVRAVF